MNAKYVKDGKFAPDWLLVDGALVVNPSEEQYLANGYEKYVPPVAEP